MSFLNHNSGLSLDTNNSALTPNLDPYGANPMPTNSVASAKVSVPMIPVPMNVYKAQTPSTSLATKTSPLTDAKTSPTLKLSAKSALKNQIRTKHASPLAAMAYAILGMSAPRRPP
eukprot:CCRYP_012605-RA/>CCRYP_012605-RA protein AED:0.46 eAED:0.62 QI:0/-1/0/1/-1/1/1/0/115